MTYQIGVDAGGTHTTAYAFDEKGEVLATAETGQGNVNTDLEGGLKNIIDAVNEVKEHVGFDCERVLIGSAGLSVIGGADELAVRISEAVGDLPVKMITDSLLALLNGLEGSDGTIVIAGTGSVVNGLQNGNTIVVGGYGSILGDEGSGYKIALTAMQSALHSWDKREHNSLIELFTNHFGVKHMNDCNAKFYQLTNTEVASMAALVGKLADSGDEDARKIIVTQAHDLAEQINTCLDRFEQPKPMRIALTGSVLTKNGLLRACVEDAVKSKYPEATFTIASGSNARGVLFDRSEGYLTAN